MTMGTQIPDIAEKPLETSGDKKVHDWVVEQLADLFHTTPKVKTQHHLTVSPTTISEVVLTRVLKDTYITLMI
jgi:hypothetical protein